ncbi:hypothetical protein FUAX_02880 [Fulvitalea axinellae]|uniref:Uncharacterized protein n=1 Tax=Fulvitalea axinellae TaxID=1182444 RepID=A0AAU9D4X7_9BACT|nr:hypothetical protein FUAX_02880 [Fulvitalea axinellae]
MRRSVFMEIALPGRKILSELIMFHVEKVPV